MSEKRKIVRHSFDETVTLNVEGQVVAGRTIDISQEGVKVVVTMPGSFQEVRQVSVSLPGSSKLHSIPCSLHRSDVAKDEEGEWVLGLSFDFETATQMLLIEKYLDSVFRKVITKESAPSESRHIPRTDCFITDVTSEVDGVLIHSIDNISTDGALISFSGKLTPGSAIPLIFALSDGKEAIKASSEVVYIINNGLGNIDSAGLIIQDINESDRNRLSQYILEMTSSAAIKEFHDRLSTHISDEEFLLDDQKEIESIFNVLAEKSLTINTLAEASLSIIETKVENLQNGTFLAFHPDAKNDDNSRSSKAAYFSFTLDGASYYFNTEIIGSEGQYGLYRRPEVMFRAEKRSSRREESLKTVGMALNLDGMSDVLHGRVIDQSRRGFLCEIPLDDIGDKLPRSGQAIDFTVGEKEVPDGHGEIRHARASVNEKGEAVLRVGIETGITRREPYFLRFSDSDWAAINLGDSRSVGDTDILYPHPVAYHNEEGLTIKALVHATTTTRPSTVIVIPPAFGKKKESQGPLALTLLAHFLEVGEDVAIVRYDGIGRPGESHNENPHARRGYEMLDYRIEQGFFDLQSTIDWVRSTDMIVPKKIAVISSSMSSLDTRRMLCQKKDSGIDLWIKLMGIPSAQNAYRTILGGLDIIANRRMGIPNGTLGLLGHLMDMDRMADDFIALDYANVSDAREQLSRITIPICWIYGAYDKWIVPDEIHDVMSIQSPASRDVVEIPTGHNLRTSDDARKAFNLIAGIVLDKLTGKVANKICPEKREVLNLITWERERLPKLETLDVRRYWRSYLVGEELIGEGYDFYRRLKEFRSFLQDETRLLDPRPAESIADLGCGTGLLTENLLVHLDEYGEDLSGTNLVAVDLVPEALAKVREKVRLITRARPGLAKLQFDWLPIDLEPDRLGPIRRFIEDPTMKLDVLVGLLPGIVEAKFRNWIDTIPDEITALFRGVVPPPDLEPYLNVYLLPEDLAILRDLGKAARFLSKTTLVSDVVPQRRTMLSGPHRNGAMDTIRTSDLLLETLDLGDKDRWGDTPLGEVVFDKIAASLLLSYLNEPYEAVNAFYRMLKPGGRLLVSSMKPDSDLSGIFTAYIDELDSKDKELDKSDDREQSLQEARQMLNEAASLFELEEDGYFRFFDESEIADMFVEAGFESIEIHHSMGEPAQTVIITGYKP